MADIVIRNIDCITGESAESGKDMLRNVTLIIKDGYIDKILTEEESQTPFGQELITKECGNAAFILDGHGRVAAPGLVNTHTHIAMAYSVTMWMIWNSWIGWKRPFGRPKLS